MMAPSRLEKYLPRPAHGIDVAAGAGTLAVAAAAGIAGMRHRMRLQPLPVAASEQLGLPETTWRGAVVADDGVALSVQEIGSAAAELTVVFVHGYCQSAVSWCHQATWLSRRGGGQIRMVLFDQRGHGRSGTPTPFSCTTEQTARDLATVIRERVPTGPIVVAGHSMGGMTTMALGRVGGDIIDRVRGIVLIATAASGLDRGGIPRLLLNPAGHALVSIASYLPWLTETLRSLIYGWTTPIVHGGSFGNQRTAAEVLAINQKMIETTESTTILNFFEALQTHDETDGLRDLSHIPGVIIAGSRDRMVPPRRSDDIAKQWPAARLVRVPGAGHMVHLERPDVVNEALLGMLRGAGWPVAAD